MKEDSQFPNLSKMQKIVITRRTFVDKKYAGKLISGQGEGLGPRGNQTRKNDKNARVSLSQHFTVLEESAASTASPEGILQP